jgi:hypothetical protein
LIEHGLGFSSSGLEKKKQQQNGTAVLLSFVLTRVYNKFSAPQEVGKQ